MTAIKETSLAAQLRKLETPQSNLLKERKTRTSFLYQSNEANTIDKDTHYTICLSGFRQICSIDPNLEEFGDSLFSIASKDLDRALLSKEANERLNGVIKNFLYRALSPYFMLSCTHKMLEWLVYRYSVHEFNVDHLLLAVLPYHETKLFPRVVQLCASIREPSNKWHWLINVQKNGVPLPKASMINHCASHPSTVRALLDLILEAVKGHYKVPVIISFFTSTIVNVLETDFDDNFVSIIISYLVKGFKSSDSSLITSSYLILSHVTTRVVLKASKLEKLLSKMCKYFIAAPLRTRHVKDFLLTLIVVHEYQELEIMSEKVISAVDLIQEEVLEVLEKVESKYFLTSLLTYYINQCDPKGLDDALFIMKDLKLTSWTISRCLNVIAQRFDEPKDENIKEKLNNIVRTLERNFPIEFDQALNESSLVHQEQLVVSSFYARFNDKNVNVFSGLLHPSKRMRLHSAVHIAKNHKTILKCNNDLVLQRITSALTNTWTESNPAVLIELLSCKELFIKMVPLTDLIDYGKKLFPRCVEMIEKEEARENHDEANDWRTVERSCFNLFSDLDYKDESQFWDLFVDYFIPLEKAGLSLFSVIFNTAIEKTNKNLFAELKPIFSQELQQRGENGNYGTSINMVSSKIAEHIEKHPNSPLLDLLNQPGVDNFRKHILGLCILYHLLPKLESFSEFNKYALINIQIFSKVLDSAHIKSASQDQSAIKDLQGLIDENLEYLRKRRFTGPMVHLFVSRILSCSKRENHPHPWYWHDQTTETNHLYSLFNFLCYQSHANKRIEQTSRTLLGLLLKEIQEILPQFLAGLWARTDDPLLQARALNVACHVMKDIKLKDVELISFLIALQSTYPSVRISASKLLELPSQQDELIDFIKEYKEKFENDENEISRVLAKYFDSVTNSQLMGRLDFPLFVKYLKNLDVPCHIRVGLAKHIQDYNTIDCLKVFLDILDNYLEASDSNLLEIELCLLSCRKIMVMLPKLENPADHPRMVHILNKTLQKEHYRSFILNHIRSDYVMEFEHEAGKIFCIEILLNFVTEEKLAKRKLRKFLEDGELVAKIIEKSIIITPNPDESTPRKKRRMERSSQQKVSQDPAEWKKIVLIFEIFATRDSFPGSNELMRIAFMLLKETFLREEKSSSEYFRSLLLVIISNCLNQEDVNLENFQLSYILESLRHARLRETQMQALTIITRISSHFKNDILRDIMVIFGFIGNDMVKCDDQYTHKILDDTMDTIIPGLVATSEDSQKQIIETFIDAFNDIPIHRRLYLFNKLTTLLGGENCLWFIVLKLIQKMQYNDDQKKAILEFIQALVCSFDGTTQMETLNKLMTMCLTVAKTGVIEAFTDVIRFSESGRKDVIRSHIQAIVLIVSAEDFISAIAESKWSDMEDLFKNLLETNLLLIDQCVKNDNRAANISSKLLPRELLKVLEKVNSLLPGPEFVSVIHRLLNSSALIVRRKALELFNSRLTVGTHERLEVSMLRDFVEPIMKIIVGVKESQTDQDIITSQTGLMSIKILAKLLKNDEESIDQLKKALETIISIGQVRETIPSPNLLASIILCIAQLVASLQNDCLSMIPSVLSIILQTLLEKSEILLLSCLTALIKVTRYFSKFLSSNLVELLIKICQIDRDSCNSVMAQKVNTIVDNLATLVPFRILVQSLEDAYSELETPDSLYTLLSILSKGLANSDKTDIEPNLTQLQKFSLKLLDYRYANTNKLSSNQVDKVEEKSLEAIISFVPKLSEASFRPFFYKIYDWALLCNEDDRHLRLITFYRLTDKLASKLKSLFCIFAAPYIVNNCVQQLKAFHIHPDTSSKGNQKQLFDEDVGHLIILHILSTLAKCFQHDINSAFVTKDRATKLVPHIIDQISNNFGSYERYKERIDEGVVKCLQHLVKAVNDYNIIKEMNNKLLLETRENSAKIRCQALHVLHQIILSMAEEYLPLLPEAIPFLAELHEDDSEDIQKLLLVVFSDIEKIFGEPIRSYF